MLGVKLALQQSIKSSKKITHETTPSEKLLIVHMAASNPVELNELHSHQQWAPVCLCLSASFVHYLISIW